MDDLVLITGATGLLGRALADVLPYRTIPCSSKTFDITNNDATTFYIARRRPNIIIHCAAVGSVDKVQSDVVLGFDVNMRGTLNIIEAAEIVKAKLVFVSTNAVFDGRSPLYTEESALCPISNYGIIKAAAEFAVRASESDWMIIRPILMYGYGGDRPNWVTTWLKMLQEGKSCLVVDDTITQPLYNYDCAAAIAKALKIEAWGQVFNVGGGDRCSLFEFARKVAGFHGYNQELIKAVPSSYFANIAPRPRDTSYDLTKIRTVLKHSPLCIYDGLKEMRDHQC